MTCLQQSKLLWFSGAIAGAATGATTQRKHRALGAVLGALLGAIVVGAGGDPLLERYSLSCYR